MTDQVRKYGPKPRRYVTGASAGCRSAVWQGSVSQSVSPAAGMDVSNVDLRATSFRLQPDVTICFLSARGMSTHVCLNTSPTVLLPAGGLGGGRSWIGQFQQRSSCPCRFYVQQGSF
jgi:hypothetical protein